MKFKGEGLDIISDILVIFHEYLDYLGYELTLLKQLNLLPDGFEKYFELFILLECEYSFLTFDSVSKAV